MNVFSKPIQKNDNNEVDNKSKYKKNKNNENLSKKIFTYKDYFDNNVQLKKFTIPVLKQHASYYKLYISGNKSVLIERLHNYFLRERSVIIIQSCFRKFLVKKYWNMRGPALLRKDLCVNDTDFNTLDPINEIDFYDFYSYKDDTGFIYGFHLKSIIMMFKKTGDIINPYNREKFTNEQIRKIVSLYKWSIYREKIINIKNIISNINSTTTNSSQYIHRNYNTNNNLNLQNINHRSQVLANLNEIRNNSVERRARDVFIEIDLLGNYTQVSWFMNLTLAGYIRFIQSLHDLWTWYANMSNIVKRSICPYYNPFSYGVEQGNIFLNRRPNIYYLKTNCLAIIENIVFSGGDIEHRKLGVIHILSALTLVSRGARQDLPWLFESITYDNNVYYNETENVNLNNEFTNSTLDNIQQNEYVNNNISNVSNITIVNTDINNNNNNLIENIY